MLVWLIDQLLEAEAAGEKVHILSHVPPGNAECLGAWGREYSRIISRFEKTITGQFHGHNVGSRDIRLFYGGSKIHLPTPLRKFHSPLGAPRLYSKKLGLDMVP